jgi:hypothetical protein
VVKETDGTLSSPASVGLAAIALTAIVLALSACSSIPVKTQAQGLYAAYGTYEAAQGAFATYAESPGANPAIVHAVRRAKDSEGARTAIAFGRAYAACHGDSTAVSAVPGIACAQFSFTPQGINAAATQLRSLVVTMGQR